MSNSMHDINTKLDLNKVEWGNFACLEMKIHCQEYTIERSLCSDEVLGCHANKQNE